MKATLISTTVACMLLALVISHTYALVDSVSFTAPYNGRVVSGSVNYNNGNTTIQVNIGLDTYKNNSYMYEERYLFIKSYINIPAPGKVPVVIQSLPPNNLKVTFNKNNLGGTDNYEFLLIIVPMPDSIKIQLLSEMVYSQQETIRQLTTKTTSMQTTINTMNPLVTSHTSSITLLSNRVTDLETVNSRKAFNYASVLAGADSNKWTTKYSADDYYDSILEGNPNPKEVVIDQNEVVALKNKSLIGRIWIKLQDNWNVKCNLVVSVAAESNSAPTREIYREESYVLSGWVLIEINDPQLIRYIKMTSESTLGSACKVFSFGAYAP